MLPRSVDGRLPGWDMVWGSHTGAVCSHHRRAPCRQSTGHRMDRAATSARLKFSTQAPCDTDDFPPRYGCLLRLRRTTRLPRTRRSTRHRRRLAGPQGRRLCRQLRSARVRSSFRHALAHGSKALPARNLYLSPHGGLSARVTRDHGLADRIWRTSRAGLGGRSLPRHESSL